jgi:hypothetical protein
VASPIALAAVSASEHPTSEVCHAVLSTVAQRAKAEAGVSREGGPALNIRSILARSVGPSVRRNCAETITSLTNRQQISLAGLWLSHCGVTVAVDFELVGEITDVDTIAAGKGIRDLPRLRRLYARGYWRTMKGNARIRLRNGRIRLAELV